VNYGLLAKFIGNSSRLRW